MLDWLIGEQKPLGWMLAFWPVLAVAFVGSLAATVLCRRVAIRLGIVDRPDHLVKTHTEPVAYLGGPAMFVGLTAGSLVGVYLLHGDRAFSHEARWLLAVLAGAAVACLVGLADDILDLRPRHKMLGQVLAAAVLLLAGINPNLEPITRSIGLSLPTGVEMVLDALIVVLFVLGATNSLNLLDGLDGLCAGVTVIIGAAMLLLAVHLATWDAGGSGDPVRIVICLGLVGGVCGFLPFNRHPARIFMGDAGSMLLGFVAAALMILFAQQSPRCWLASVAIFGLPILDATVTVVRRLLNRRPLFVSDRGHIYDQMIDRGTPLRKTVMICYVLAGLYAVIGLLMSRVQTCHAIAVGVLTIAVSALVVWRKGYHRQVLRIAGEPHGSLESRRDH